MLDRLSLQLLSELRIPSPEGPGVCQCVMKCISQRFGESAIEASAAISMSASYVMLVKLKAKSQV